MTCRQYGRLTANASSGDRLSTGLRWAHHAPGGRRLLRQTAQIRQGAGNRRVVLDDGAAKIPNIENYAAEGPVVVTDGRKHVSYQKDLGTHQVRAVMGRGQIVGPAAIVVTAGCSEQSHLS